MTDLEVGDRVRHLGRWGTATVVDVKCHHEGRGDCMRVEWDDPEGNGHVVASRFEKMPSEMKMEDYVLKSDVAKALDAHLSSYSITQSYILADLGIVLPKKKWRLTFEVETQENLDDYYDAQAWIEEYAVEAVDLVSSEEVK